MAVPSRERQLVGNVWTYRTVQEGGGNGGATPGAVAVESVTLTAAEIAARYDGDATVSMVEAFDFGIGDVLLTVGSVSTLDAGTSGGIYLAASGLSSAAVYSDADLSIAASDLANVQADGVQGELQWNGTTVVLANRAGYVNVSDASPTTGELTVYALIARA